MKASRVLPTMRMVTWSMSLNSLGLRLSPDTAPGLKSPESLRTSVLRLAKSFPLKLVNLKPDLN